VIVVGSLEAPSNVEDKTKGKKPEVTKKFIVGNPMAPPNVKDQTKGKRLEDMREIIMGSPMVPPSVEGIRVNIVEIRG